MDPLLNVTEMRRQNKRQMHDCMSNVFISLFTGYELIKF
jgi:hypothetical protein